MYVVMVRSLVNQTRSWMYRLQAGNPVEACVKAKLRASRHFLATPRKTALSLLVAQPHRVR